MPNEKSYIFNTKRTLLIIVGVILALIITWNGTGFISMNPSNNTQKTQVTYKPVINLPQWISKASFTGAEISVSTGTQLLKN